MTKKNREKFFKMFDQELSKMLSILWLLIKKKSLEKSFWKSQIFKKKIVLKIFSVKKFKHYCVNKILS